MIGEWARGGLSRGGTDAFLRRGKNKLTKSMENKKHIHDDDQDDDDDDDDDEDDDDDDSSSSSRR